MSKPAQCRAWLLTIPAYHNLKDGMDKYGPLTFHHDGDYVGECSVNSDMCKNLNIVYICGQLEFGSGDSDGYHHYQVYVYFKNHRTMAGIKREFCCDEIHCEAVHKDNGAADYCIKDDETTFGMRFEWGTKRTPSQGARNDIHDAIATLKQTKSVKAVLLDHPDVFVKYSSGIAKANILFNEPERRTPPALIWFYGPSGSGKSFKMLELISANPTWKVYFHSPEMGEWFDGYDNHDTIVFDDFNDVNQKGETLSVDPFLRLLSETPCARQTKGGMVPIVAKRFIFTTEFTPDSYFSTASIDKRAHWDRRFRSAFSAGRLTIQKCNYSQAELPPVNYNVNIQGQYN